MVIPDKRISKKLKGTSKLQFIKEYLKDLLTMGELITDFEYDISSNKEKEIYESLLNEIFSELNGTEIEYIIKVEFELYKLNSTDESTITNEEKASLGDFDLSDLLTDQNEEIDDIDDLINELNEVDELEESNNKDPKKILEEKLGNYRGLLNESLNYEDKALYSKVLSSFYSSQTLNSDHMKNQ